MSTTLMLGALKVWGHTVEGVWGCFFVFNVSRLAFGLRHHFVDGPPRRRGCERKSRTRERKSRSNRRERRGVVRVIRLVRCVVCFSTRISRPPAPRRLRS